LITICDFATITSRVVILTHDASSNRRINGTFLAPVEIGKRSFIGYCSIILPGVTIGEDAIVGAGSVVTKDVEDGHIVAGCPAKSIGRVKDTDLKLEILMSNLLSYPSEKGMSDEEKNYVAEKIRQDKGGFHRSL